MPAAQATTVVSLPVWIPGSYMVREFGRHLSALQARRGRQAATLAQLDKTTWRIDSPGRGTLVLTYDVYAFDTSVRTAYLDDQRGFFNPTSLCLQVQGCEARPHELHFGPLPKGWDVATAMPAMAGKRHAFVSAGYDELVDHPFELGAFWRGQFEAGRRGP